MSWFNRSERATSDSKAFRWLVLGAICSGLLVGCPVDERTLQEGRASAGNGSAGNGLDAYGGWGANAAEAGARSQGEAGETSVDRGGASTAGDAAGGNAGRAGDSSVGGAGLGPGAGDCADLDGNQVPDCDETLVDNSRFDSDLTAWTADPVMSQSWDARNAQSARQSGSILVRNAQVVAGAGVNVGGSGQCLSTVASTSYVVAARVLLPSGQGQGSAAISIHFYGAEACAAYPLGSAGPAPVSLTDEWTSVDGTVKAPAAARSMRVKLVASKPFAQAQLQALFDDVLVREQ